jgi:hypothetical protein
MKVGHTSTLDDSASTTATRTLFTTSMDPQFTSNLPSQKPFPSTTQMPLVSRISRLSLQNLTTFFSWPRRIITDHNDPAELFVCNSTSGSKPLRKYVSKGVQLKKLQLRLENDGLLGMEHLDSRCKKCYSRPILL